MAQQVSDVEAVLKLLAAGADVTPFTFPAGVLGGPLGGGSLSVGADLALALQSGYSLPLLMSSAGMGGGAVGPLPLPAALALPSLELPKLLSLDMGTDATGTLPLNGRPAAAGDSSEPSGSGGAGLLPPRAGSRGQTSKQLLEPIALPARQGSQGAPASASKRGADAELAGPSGRNKRPAFEAPAGIPSVETLLAVAEREAEREAELDRAREQLQLELQQAMERAERPARERARQMQQEEEEAEDTPQQEPTDSDSDTSGGNKRKAARGGKRKAANGGGSSAPKDPAARAHMRQLKKRDLNREAQRRFRDRQKAALALLESTTQSQQREIEALRLTNKLMEEQYRVLLEQYKALQLRFVTLQMKTGSK